MVDTLCTTYPVVNKTVKICYFISNHTFNTDFTVPLRKTGALLMNGFEFVFVASYYHAYSYI